MTDLFFSVDTLFERAREFDARLRELKAGLAPEAFWYPYGGAQENVYLMSKFLSGYNRDLGHFLGDRSIVDIGAADGELAFFMESVGCRATIIDHHATNFNGLEGARRLKQALASNVEIVDLDFDRTLSLPGTYDFAFFLGTLYHFKNPYGALEELARRARYCVLSTKVMRSTPDLQLNLHDYPLAYLVDTHETNNDPTNYWILTEMALRRLLSRTGWRVLDYQSFGSAAESDPSSCIGAGDERAFCLLESDRR